MITPEQLQKFGLAPKESRVYIAMLELGEPSAVTTISKRANINRTTTYDILQTLCEKNLVVHYTHKSIQYWLFKHFGQIILKELRKAEDKTSIFWRSDLRCEYRSEAVS